ncbi:hypothetical protein JCM9140_4068 [Halalkalibacter wakoensis JCM 9140]|uniref:Uncharacterized protein n=1 Tax=Halalkalibacter wakoensis JCM 9140 TaxID=1236970 RepID=W4Q773_9BACI|nr:DUF441 family protein [Halalkalibacter wakoensis]GAE27901.1 hypothetical protein JCM9140_4068 [Halalkalibacter wakoensis JCM 9140]
MFSQASVFMLILLLVAVVAKNQSLIVAVTLLLVVKWVGLGDKLFPIFQQKGIRTRSLKIHINKSFGIY